MRVILSSSELSLLEESKKKILLVDFVDVRRNTRRLCPSRNTQPKHGNGGPLDFMRAVAEMLAGSSHICEIGKVCGSL